MWKSGLFLLFITVGFFPFHNEDSRLQLVWSDDFDYSGLPDTTKWTYDLGDGCPNLCGWGNNELQYYTENRLENTWVEDGILTIKAIKEPIGEREYSSARIVTKNKGDWKYGRFEIRAKMPSGRGSWPAIWMLPTDNTYGGWPHSGEIDIVEHVGFDPDHIYGNTHTWSNNGMHGTDHPGKLELKKAETAFHTYAIEWTEDKIEWFVNKKKFRTYERIGNNHESWPYDQRFHLIMNIAVGGNWGGAKGVDDSIWPQQMEIDYVRVYSIKEKHKKDK